QSEEAKVDSPKVFLNSFSVCPDGSDTILKPREGGEENINQLEKRSVEMLSLGRSASDDCISTKEKKQLKMLRLGKRQLKMLRLGKRQLKMLRLGKRQLKMLRLGKRQLKMLRLGKTQLKMLRLGK
ncbi:hypothetical protein BgiBS90_018408, partial [Biomphalaria glabrata]